MSSAVISVSPEDTVSEAARLLGRYNIGSVPVCSSDNRLRGILTDRDIVTRCVAAERDPERTPVREIMSKSVLSVDTEDDVREAARKMSEGRVRRVPVTRGGELVGIIALGDMARTHEFDMEASAALSEISENVSRL
jgi:CBS domain-containing protein